MNAGAKPLRARGKNTAGMAQDRVGLSARGWTRSEPGPCRGKQDCIVKSGDCDEKCNARFCNPLAMSSFDTASIAGLHPAQAPTTSHPLPSTPPSPSITRPKSSVSLIIASHKLPKPLAHITQNRSPCALPCTTCCG